MCKTTQKAQTQERNANDNEPRVRRSAKLHRAIPLQESAERINIARKCHPNKRSSKGLYGLYEVLAPGSVARKFGQHTLVIPEPGKLDETVCNSDIAKIVTRGELKTKLTENINRLGPRILEKSNEAKILSHAKKIARIQKGDSKKKFCKRDTASGVSSN